MEKGGPSSSAVGRALALLTHLQSSHGSLSTARSDPKTKIKGNGETEVGGREAAPPYLPGSVTSSTQRSSLPLSHVGMSQQLPPN